MDMDLVILLLHLDFWQFLIIILSDFLEHGRRLTEATLSYYLLKIYYLQSFVLLRPFGFFNEVIYLRMIVQLSGNWAPTVPLPLCLPVVGKQGGRARHRHVLIIISLVMLAILSHVSLALTICDSSNGGNQAICGRLFKVVSIRLLLGQRCDPIATL